MQAGVLSGNEIEKQVAEGRITIDPYSPDFVNPASYDLTLGEEVRVYQGCSDTLEPKDPIFDRLGKVAGGLLADVAGQWGAANPKWKVLDSRAPNPTETFKIGPEGLVLVPGIGYLMHTAERVATNHYVPVLDGKSSLGRLFVQVHVTAGYGDPGFDGQFTLEVIVTHPVRVYAGMRFCQVRFHTIAGEPRLYKGRYKGEAAVGAVPSRSWEQYKEDHEK